MIDTAVTVTDTAAAVVEGGATANRPADVYLSVPSGGDTVFVGGPDVDGSTHGVPIAAGETLHLHIVNETIYAVTETSQALNRLVLGV